MKKSGKSLLLLVLSLLLFSVPCSLCYADVILTDSEATELLSTIQESKTELQSVKEELAKSKETLQTLSEELSDVKNDYIEQKKSYEEQLSEAEKDKQSLKTWLTITATSSGVLLITTILLIIL